MSCDGNESCGYRRRFCRPGRPFAWRTARELRVPAHQHCHRPLLSAGEEKQVLAETDYDTAAFYTLAFRAQVATIEGMIFT
ncbi:hypothetical protein MUN86_30830 (plasmid) [Hymenobacter volaticus]|uniref:Uncharacterized protein n=1 Tax=Hymenobacter volaticus TaxID=2932254 RepID=A0ABY4GG71_9BACT|nr:hypothetical protein MUN86_30830 [Hymenobacter volaticus]